MSKKRSIKQANTALNGYISRDVYAEKSQHVVDLLADLMHYCIARKINFAEALRIAKSHFDAEHGTVELKHFTTIAECLEYAIDVCSEELGERIAYFEKHEDEPETVANMSEALNDIETVRNNFLNNL